MRFHAIGFVCFTAPGDLPAKSSLSFADIDFINSKPAAERLDLAAQLKFFNTCGFFVADRTGNPDDAGDCLAEQFGIRADELFGYDFDG